MDPDTTTLNLTLITRDIIHDNYFPKQAPTVSGYQGRQDIFLAGQLSGS